MEYEFERLIEATETLLQERKQLKLDNWTKPAYRDQLPHYRKERLESAERGFENALTDTVEDIISRREQRLVDRPFDPFERN